MRTVRIVLLVTGLLIAGLGATFIIIGLDKADKLASTVGGLASVAGVGLSLWIWLTGSLGETRNAINANVEHKPGQGERAGMPGTTYHVQIERGRHIQIGDNNIQNNGK
ncbi:hypothetical protein V6W11_12540 [Micromonospora profundi]|uniref:hypothetical protein n=1 Tax=Micromonospora profundi TaxID=1420889 RepID=UPI002FF29DA4